MRVGDFSVEVVAAEGGVREIESGHVLARPGQVYKLRLRNHSPLRAVAEITIDGHTVTGRGLVVDALSTLYLERPIHETERGRFTVIAEGDERVFGPDGGRDNANLGLIEARFRRELPEPRREWSIAPIYPTSAPLSGDDPPLTAPGRPEPNGPWRPGMPRFTPPTWDADSAPIAKSARGGIRGAISAFLSSFSVESPAPTENHAPRGTGHVAALGTDEVVAAPRVRDAEIERAAGTGLTGSSRQEFEPVYVGKLEPEATVIRLRLVIGSEEALSAPRPLPESNPVPARPAARP